MSKLTKKSVSVLVILICIASVYMTKFFLGRFAGNMSKGALAKSKGSDNAPIKVIEFIDFQCPACAGGAAYLKETIEKYPGAIHLELKHFPLAMHRHGFLSSKYAECAAKQGKFWDFQDRLLAQQSNWQRLIDPRPAFERIADDVRIDKEELDACAKDDSTVDAIITKNKAEGKALGIQSTPTYFVNKKMIVGKKSLDLEIKKLLTENGY